MLAYYDGQADSDAVVEDEARLAVAELNGLPAEKLEDIRWELVQRSWNGPLRPNERLRLGAVEALIDAEDRVSHASQLAAESQLRQRQDEILSSLEHLIADLRK